MKKQPHAVYIILKTHLTTFDDHTLYISPLVLDESAIEILFSDFGVSKDSETFSITIPPLLQVTQQNKSAKSLISL